MTGTLPTAKGVSAEFGYYPLPWSVETDRFSVRQSPNFLQTVEDLATNPGVSKNWIYPGARRTHDMMSGEVHLMPFQSRVFGLPKTHILTLHESNYRDELDFVVWCLSFFTGMRLTTTNAGFLDATPIRTGELVDFILVRSTLIDAVHLALDYLLSERADPRAPKRVAAVIHALFLAQRPQNLCFERFTYLYMALDACFSLLQSKEAKKPNTKHGDRISWMCGKFNMPVPAWADSGQPGFSSARNNTFHEALFFDQPLGFAVYGGNLPGAAPDNVTLQMQALICRLLVGILGRPGSDYVGTPVDTRQIHGLELTP
jgi:hypothetical protein